MQPNTSALVHCVHRAGSTLSATNCSPRPPKRANLCEASVHPLSPKFPRAPPHLHVHKPMKVQDALTQRGLEQGQGNA